MDTRVWRHFDFWLIGGVALLIIVGVAMIRSTTLTSVDTEIQALPGRQILWALIGAAIFVVTTAIDYRFWHSTSNTMYLFFVSLLVLVLFFGVESFGARRWFDLQVIDFQPSELGKFLIVLTLGSYVANHGSEMHRLGFVLRTLVHVGLPMALIFLEPDLSTSVIYGIVWIAILWSAGLRWRHLGLFLAVAAIALPIGFLVAYATPGLRYMAERLVIFLFPDPNSPTHVEQSYNITQALIAIGSGGWFGQGYGHGSQVQLRFLKVRHTDFIFASLSNEFGFVGGALIILLVAVLVYRIFRAGQRARDPFGAYICYGVGVILLYQAYFNIGMNMNSLPVSGIPLPFVSYGGSALWTFLFGIGLVESVVLRHKQIEF